MKQLIDQATDPEQYSNGKAVTWIADDARQINQQEKFWDAVKPVIGSDCKSALDIGCGSGWSAKKFFDLGSDWIGLEPSSSHFEIAKKLHPELNILNTTFEKYHTDAKFDRIIAIMVLSHMKNVGDSFKKIFGLLDEKGIFIMICSTFHDGASRFERNGRKYQVETIDDDQYVDKAIVGAYGIADINRKPEYYVSQAISSGFVLVEHSKIEDEGYSPKELLVFEKTR